MQLLDDIVTEPCLYSIALDGYLLVRVSHPGGVDHIQ